tara:strand:+ start:16052 stop:17869 length:1818 start_codon:yes stop_codon:yes gene_type:complete
MFILKKLLNIFFSTSFTKITFKLSSYFLVRKKIIFVLLFLGIFIVLFDILCAGILTIFFTKNNNLDNIPFLGWIVPQIENLNSISIIIMIIFLQLLRESANFFNAYIPGIISNNLEREAKDNMLINFFSIDKKELDKLNKNEIVVKIANMTPAFAAFCSDFVKFLTNSLIVILYLFSIIYYKTVPSLIIILLLIFVSIITNKIILVQKKLSRLYRDNCVKHHDNLINTFYGIDEILINNKKSFFSKYNKKITNNVFQLGIKSIKYLSLLAPIQRSMSIILLGSLLIISEYLTTLDIEFISFHASLIIIFFLFRIQTPIVEINNLRSSLFKRQAYVESIINEITEKRVPKKKFKGKGIIKLDDIKFKNVVFSYQKKRIIKKINLIIKQKSIVGIIGETGAGKSTLINLILKLYNPSSGSILMGNKDISSFSEYQWRNMISVIPQKGHIFNTSVKNNISMFQKNASFENIKRAADIAGIGNYIDSLPKKYNTVIGGKTIELSGGQIQKIFIARAIFNKPKILILDEATSSQDALSEKKIMMQIKKIFVDSTIIIVTHRMSFLRFVDKIYYLKKGKVVENGTWSELYNKKNSLFRNMANLQKIEKTKI